MISIPKHLCSLLQKAAVKAIPALTEPVTVTAERNKDWDYTSPTAMKVFNMSKKTGSFGFASCQELAQAVLAQLEAPETIESVELKQAGQGDPSKAGFFLNIQLKNAFLEEQLNRLLRVEALSIDTSD